MYMYMYIPTHLFMCFLSFFNFFLLHTYCSLYCTVLFMDVHMYMYV